MQAGFTILELFVSLSLMLVLAAIGTPMLSDYNQQLQVRSTIDRLSTEIGRARMQAMAQSSFVRVRFENGQFIRERSADGLAYSRIGFPLDLPSGVSATVEGSSSIIFDSTGIAPSPSIITIQDGNSARTLYTNILGRVSVS